MATNTYHWLWQNIRHNAVSPPTDFTFIIVSFSKHKRLSKMWQWSSYSLRKKHLDEMSDNFRCQEKLDHRPLSINREFSCVCVCVWVGAPSDEWGVALGADPSGPQTIQTGPHAEAHILTDHPQRGGPKHWQEITSAATLSIMIISIIIGFYRMASALQTQQQMYYSQTTTVVKIDVWQILFD